MTTGAERSNAMHPDAASMPSEWLPSCIILMRQAQSADLEISQAEQRVPNHKIPLTPLGVTQAKESAQKIHHLMTEADPNYSLFVYSSPYDRCEKCMPDPRVL